MCAPLENEWKILQKYTLLLLLQKISVETFSCFCCYFSCQPMLPKSPMHLKVFFKIRKHQPKGKFLYFSHKHIVWKSIKKSHFENLRAKRARLYLFSNTVMGISPIFYMYIWHEYLLGLDPTIGYHTEDLVEELRLVGGYRLSRKMDRWSSWISCVIFLIMNHGKIL